MGIRAKLVLYAFLTSVFLTQVVCMSKTASANESNQTNIKSNTIQDLSIFNTSGAYAKEDLNNMDGTGLREIIKKELAQGQGNDAPVPAKGTSKNKDLPKGKFTINASAYTAAADECGKSDGITASGAKVKKNETISGSIQYSTHQSNIEMETVQVQERSV